jgi:WD40 repeat protein
MHFFHPIQQSASHIYHSALPLSPTSSKFHSRTLCERTNTTGFYGGPEAWGVVVRTIAASSKQFTCMATFCHKIVATCNNGTVEIYDSVTGVLGLSLSPTDHVKAITGSPDGSTLFCAHTTPSITVWDMQTGGLTHTSHLELNAEDIAVSLGGRYLACGSSDDSVKVWEVANGMEGGTIWTSSPVSRFCWLKPEEQLAVSTGALVGIYNITTGTLLHSYTLQHPVDLMVYSQKFNQLATTAGVAITIIDPQMDTHPPSDVIPLPFSRFAFSQTTNELVCGTKLKGLHLFNISTRRLKYIEHPNKMKSISCLPNGIVVANSAGSGIQLLSVGGGQAPPKRPPIFALAMHTFDQDRIVSILPTSCDHIVLLETATMSQLLKISIHDTRRQTPTGHATILCASRENLMAVDYFKKGNRGFLQSWEFHEDVPRWTVEVSGVPKIGRISPTAARLVTFNTVDGLSRVFVWNAQNGQLEAHIEDPSPPHLLEIEFTSDTEFASRCAGIGVSFTVRSQGPGACIGIGHSLPGWSQRRRDLDVDDTHEWVVRGSKRICWIPPGYIGLIQPSYCWAGHSLVMIGQDGTLRKLAFQEPL